MAEAVSEQMMTSDFQWQEIRQARLHVSVNKAIDLITHPPRPVGTLELADWSLVFNGAKHGVRHVTGITSAYYEYKLPENARSCHPVLVGVGNEKYFLIDGAHRVAKALIDGQKTIRAVVLTEEETRSCIRPGMEKRFDEKVG